MEDVNEAAQLARLMAELSWLKRLSSALLRAGPDADDLVQETWLVAAEHAPKDGRPLKPWLSRVALNLVRMRSRATKRRHGREAATELTTPSSTTPDELVSRVEAQRVVADQVLRLSEPYRSTVLLHYFEDLSSAEIARRLGIPDGTVRRRLKVALDELRERLRGDERKTGRCVLAALAPLAGGHGSPVGSIMLTLGVAVMKKILVAVLVVVLLAALWIKGAKHEAAREPGPAGPRTAVGLSSGSQHAPQADATLPPWYVPRGASERRIAGRVTYRGAPVANAIVTLHTMLTKAGIRPGLERSTAADGAFDFGLQPPARYDVTAQVPGKTAAVVRFDLSDPTLRPPPERLQLLIGPCAASVRGTISDASGGPIPHARVRRQGLVGVDADDKGSYELCVPRGDAEIAFSADGYGAVLLTIDAQGAVQQDVVLLPEAIVTGRVLHGDTGRPATNAFVSLSPKPWGRDRAFDASALTDPDGGFHLGGLLPGRYAALAFADGYVAESVDVQAGVGAANPEIILRVAPMARIEGTVVSGGKPVAGAQLAASSRDRSAGSAVSQADGTFTIERVPLGEISFSAAPYRVVSPKALKLDRAKDYTAVVIEVERLGAIRGRVTRLGRPVAGARVCCVRTVAGGGENAFSDGDGRFEIAGIPPGPQELGAESLEAGAFANPVKLELAPGEDRTVDFELDLAATIRGDVVDQDGRPVGEVFVRWTNEKTGDLGKSVTDAKGRYLCNAMSGGGLYRAAVYSTSSQQAPFPTADGGPYPTVDVKDGKTTIDGARISIEVRHLTITGHVVDLAGTPIPDAHVEGMVMAGTQQPIFHSGLRLPGTFADAGGGFTLTGLTSGMYALWARSSDGGEGTAVKVAAGSTDAVIRIERAGSIEGTLVGFASPPTIYATGSSPNENLSGTLVDATSLRVNGLHPGRYLLNAQTSTEGDARFVEVRSGATTRVTMTARGRGTLNATVLDFRTRRPISGARCHVVMSAGDMQGLTNWDAHVAPTSDANGRLTFDPSPAGPIVVACIMPTFRFSNPSTDLVLGPGGRANIELLSVEQSKDYPASIGIDFDFRVTVPRIFVVHADGPAARAGILPGDTIIVVDGASVAGLNEAGVAHLIGSQEVGAEISLTVQRAGSRKTFSVKTEPFQYQ